MTEELIFVAHRIPDSVWQESFLRCIEHGATLENRWQLIDKLNRCFFAREIGDYIAERCYNALNVSPPRMFDVRDRSVLVARP